MQVSHFSSHICPFHNGARQAAPANDGFAEALGLMQMKIPEDEGDGATDTPAPKKPRLSDEIVAGLEITPPPVVGRQSDPCFIGSIKFVVLPPQLFCFVKLF